MNTVAVLRTQQSQAITVPKHFKSPKKVADLFRHLTRIASDAGILDIGMDVRIMAACAAQKKMITMLDAGEIPSTYSVKTLSETINQIEYAAGSAKEELEAAPKASRFASNGVDRKR